MSIRAWQWVGLALFAALLGVLLLGAKGIVSFNWDFLNGFAWASGIWYSLAGIALRLRESKEHARDPSS